MYLSTLKTKQNKRKPEENKVKRNINNDTIPKSV